ncbi:MAG: hypothetical protein RIR26_268 [Pseudomonadota bacterium]
MNSDFPMTFADDSIDRPAEKTAQKMRGKTQDRADNVIPLSRGGLSVFPMSEAAPLSESITSRLAASPESMAVDYPMSEFHHDDAVPKEPSIQKSVRPILRGSLLALMLGLWVAVGTGKLNSNTPVVSHLRSALSLDSSDSVAANQMSAEVTALQHSSSQVNAEPKTSVGAQTSADLKAPVGMQTHTETKPTVAASPAEATMVQSSASAVSMSEKEKSAATSVPTTPKTDLSALTQVEIETMARLFLAQIEQFNATEEHVVQLMNAHASSGERAAFLAALQKAHEAALSKLQGKRQNSAR